MGAGDHAMILATCGEDRVVPSYEEIYGRAIASTPRGGPRDRGTRHPDPGLSTVVVTPSRFAQIRRAGRRLRPSTP